MNVETPWGRYQVLARGNDWLVKRLTVDAGKRTSLQMHTRRCEIWLMPGGGFSVVPAGTVHRLEGGAQGQTIIEVQVGDPDENDIVRLEDDYGRA